MCVHPEVPTGMLSPYGNPPTVTVWRRASTNNNQVRETESTDQSTPPCLPPSNQKYCVYVSLLGIRTEYRRRGALYRNITADVSITT